MTLAVPHALWKAVATAAVLAALLPAACGRAPGEDGTKIAGIVFQEDQFFRTVELGMKDAAGRGGAELMSGNSFGALDKEIGLIDSYIAARADALVISPLSRTASIPALERAAGQGIAVVTYNTTVEGPVPASYVESDQRDLGGSTGRAVRRYVESRLGGKAKIAMIEYMSQAPEQASLRIQGFKAALADMEGVEVVAEQDAWLVQQAADVVEQIITAHPDLDIVWAANEGGTVGAAIAVKNTGKAGRIAVFGTDMSEQLGQFLLAEDGVLHAVTGQKPFQIGSLAVEIALRILAGEEVPPRISLPGTLFSRENPGEVSAYMERLRELSQ